MVIYKLFLYTNSIFYVNPFDFFFLQTSDGMSSQPKLLEEIQLYCNRNKEKIFGKTQKEKKVNFLAESADVPVIRNEAELASLIREKTSSSRSHSCGSSNSTTSSMVCSASFPNGSKTNATPSSPRNRFQVRRVFLESEKHTQSTRESSEVSHTNTLGKTDSVQSEESVFLPSSPNESGYGSTTSPSILKQESNDGEVEFRKNYIRHQDSIAIHMQHAQSRRSNDEDDDDDDEEEEDGDTYEDQKEETDDSNKTPPDDHSSQNEIAHSQLLSRRASGGKVIKKLTFVLPDDFCEHTNGIRKDRRMSTPALTSQRVLHQKQNALNLKLGRMLEGLDLKSSVPLSPTRLREGLSKFSFFPLLLCI